MYFIKILIKIINIIIFGYEKINFYYKLKGMPFGIHLFLIIYKKLYFYVYNYNLFLGMPLYFINFSFR